jgi:hypothetical protein
MLRITDILLRNVILDCKDKDDLDKKESKLNYNAKKSFHSCTTCAHGFMFKTSPSSSFLERFFKSFNLSDPEVCVQIIKEIPVLN